VGRKMNCPFSAEDQRSSPVKLTLRLSVSHSTVLGHALPVEDLVAGGGHVVEKSTVERVVVAVVEVVVTASEGCVGLELVVGLETAFAAAAEGRGLGGSIPTDAELEGDQVTVESDTKGCQDDSEVVADVVDVLLGLDELVESDNTISAKETMVGSSVETRAGSTEGTGRWVLVLVVGVAHCRDEHVSDLGTGKTVVFGAGVRVLGGDLSGRPLGHAAVGLGELALLDLGHLVVVGHEGVCRDGYDEREE